MDKLSILLKSDNYNPHFDMNYYKKVRYDYDDFDHDDDFDHHDDDLESEYYVED